MTGAEDDDPPNKYILTPSIDANGALKLTGEDLGRDNSISVPRGEGAVVKIKDIPGLYVYGVEIAAGGERGGCWGRNAANGIARRRFDAVTTEVHNMIYAVSTNSTAAITYGPVITIKPKG